MLNKSAQKIQDIISAHGLMLQVVEFSVTTRTSQDAANAIGCDLGQIAKSIILKGAESGKPILVITSATNRVSETQIAHYVGEKVTKADASFVRAVTGFAIGGVPPIGHPHKIETFIDEDLLNYTDVWTAAGTPHAVFCIPIQDLVKLTEGKIMCVRTL